MHVIIGLLCSAAALVLMAAVAWMNYRFMARLGINEIDGQVLGIASVTVDVMLGLLGPLVMWGLATGRRLYAIGVVSIILAFATLSFVSALGFAAEGRDGAMSRRETDRLAVNTAKRRVDVLQASKERLGTQRPSAVIDVEITGLRSDRRWPETQQCISARQTTLSQWCAGVRRLSAEYASAKASEAMEEEIRMATSELLVARQASEHGLLDAQIDMIAGGTGWPEAKVRVGLLLLVAFVLQLGAGFGVALGLAPLHAYLEEKDRRRLTRPRPDGHLRSDNIALPTPEDAPRRTTADQRRRRDRKSVV